MNPPVKSLNAPLLITLTVVGCFSVLSAAALNRAHVHQPVHTVIQRPTGEPDMDGPVASAKTASDREVKLFYNRILHEAKAHDDAVVIARVFGSASPGEIAVASDQTTTRPQKTTKLWGTYTRAKCRRFEYVEAK